MDTRERLNLTKKTGRKQSKRLQLKSVYLLVMSSVARFSKIKHTLGL